MSFSKFIVMSFLFLYPSVGFSTIGYVASSSKTAAMGAIQTAVTVSLAGATSILAGQDVLVSMVIAPSATTNGVTMTSITDSGGNTYTVLYRVANTSSQFGLDIGWAHAATNASTLTANWSATCGGPSDILINQYTGVAGVGTTISNSGNSTGNPVSLISGTLNANDWMYAAFAAATTHSGASGTASIGFLRTSLPTGLNGYDVMDNTQTSALPVSNYINIGTGPTTFIAGGVQLFVFTPTPTYTNTATNTATNTFTNTFTPTNTPTVTFTPTPTPTNACGEPGLWPSQFHDNQNTNKSGLSGPVTNTTLSWAASLAPPLGEAVVDANPVVNSNGDIFFTYGQSNWLCAVDKQGTVLFSFVTASPNDYDFDLPGLTLMHLSNSAPCTEIEFYPFDYGAPLMGIDSAGSQLFSLSITGGAGTVEKYLVVDQDILGTTSSGNNASRWTAVTTAPTVVWQTSAATPLPTPHFGSQTIYPPALSGAATMATALLCLTRNDEKSYPITNPHGNGYLSIFDANSGATSCTCSWSLTGQASNSPLYQQGEYVGVLPNNNILVVNDQIAVYDRSCSLVWSATPIAGNSFSGAAAIGSNYVVAVTNGGKLYKYNSANGSVLYGPISIYQQDGLQNICLDNNDNVYVGDADILIYGYDSTLTPLPSFPIHVQNDAIVTGPTIGLSPDGTQSNSLLIGGLYSIYAYTH